MDKWIPVSERPPECKKHDFSDEVLGTFVPNWNKKVNRVIKVVYVPYHNCTDEDIGFDTSDVSLDEWELADEDNSIFWIPEGWYETIDNSIYDCSYVAIDGKITAWMPLPAPYKGGGAE